MWRVALVILALCLPGMSRAAFVELVATPAGTDAEGRALWDLTLESDTTLDAGATFAVENGHKFWPDSAGCQWPDVECHESEGWTAGFPGILYFIWTVHTAGSLGDSVGSPQLMGRLATEGYPVLTLEGVSDIYGTTEFFPDVPNENVSLTVIGAPDSDRDGLPDFADNCPASFNPGQEDSDFDLVGDLCDNCRFRANTGQEDTGGVVGIGLGGGFDPDGVGDVCQCGDMSGDGFVDSTDAVLYRRYFAGLGSAFSLDRCSVVGPDGVCNTTDVVVMRRTFAGLGTGVVQNVCPAYLGLPDPGNL